MDVYENWKFYYNVQTKTIIRVRPGRKPEIGTRSDWNTTGLDVLATADRLDRREAAVKMLEIGRREDPNFSIKQVRQMMYMVTD